MKRLIGLLTFGLGVLLLVMSPLVKFGVAPRLAKAPLDLDVTLPHGGGPFEVLDPSQGGVVSLPYVSVSRHIVANTARSNGDVAVYEEALCLNRSDNHAQLTCTSGKDSRTIANYFHSIAFDRKTGMAVNGKKCGKSGDEECDNREISYEGEPEEDQKRTVTGLSTLFPMGTKKQAYPLFDDPSGKAWPAEFVGEEKREGLTVYKFVQKIVDAETTTKGLPSLYSNTRTLWVEPTTGAVIHGQEEIDQRLTGEEPGKSGINPELEGKTALKGTLAFTPEADRTQAEKARDGIHQLSLIRTWLPLGLLIGGLAFTLLGFLLQRGRRDHRDEVRAAAPGGPETYHHRRASGYDERVVGDERTRTDMEPVATRPGDPGSPQDVPMGFDRDYVVDDGASAARPAGRRIAEDR